MKQNILFRLTSNHLLVANSGNPFSKEGLESLGYIDTSAKKNFNQSTTPNSEEEAKSLISEIINTKCQTFKHDPKELDSAGGTEQRTAKDYIERLLLELMQNAIDAGAETQIGNKGIGFRSLLNGSSSTEVHSGHFHVRWSDKDAKEQLNQKGIKTAGKRIPVLALPTWCYMDEEIRTLLDGPYDTVIKLSLTRKGREKLIEEWEKFSTTPSLLLFVNSTINLRWEREGNPQMQWYRFQKDEHVIVKVTTEDLYPKMECWRWRLFQSEGAIAAYRVDKDLQFVENSDENPLLYSFFPAALSSHPFPNLYLHHSDFDLQSNRQAVNIDETCLNDLSEAIIMAVSSMENEIDILDSLRVNPSIPKVVLSTLRQDKKTEISIWEKVRPELVKKKFKGLENRRLTDIKSCPKYEKMPDVMHDENRWKIWKAFLSALKATLQNSFFDLPMLQPGTENKQREETLLRFCADAPFGKEEIRELAWAPVESSDHLLSSSKIKVFLPCKKIIQRPPDGIEVRFLTLNFLENFRNKDTNAISFLTKVLGVHEFSAMGVIEHCVLPALKKVQIQEASEELIEFLKTLREADTKEAKTNVDFFDWENPIRCDLARNLHLKCQEKIWPIFQVYADQKWTGNQFLEKAYGRKRGFLEKQPPKDKKDKASWEHFWKWLGVGWSPKVMPLLDDVVYQLHNQKGLEWDKGKNIFKGIFFNKKCMPNNWHRYCEVLIEKAYSLSSDKIKTRFEYSSSNKSTPRMKKNWTIDGGSRLLKKPGAFQIIVSNWPVYEKWTDTMISYSSNKQFDSDNLQTQKYHNFPSYLFWLIQAIPWVPCIDGCLYEGNKVFRKDSPVAKKIPQFIPVLKMTENDEPQEKLSMMEAFLNKCGIRHDWKEVKDIDWELWMKKASIMQPNDGEHNSNRDAIRLLYRSLIDHRALDNGNKWNKQPAEPINSIPLWGIEYPDRPNENWCLRDPASPPYFVDRGDLADMGLPGLYLFPVRLDRLSKKANIHFGLKSLSESLKGKPLNDGDSCPEYSRKAQERINELVAYLRMDNKKNSDKEIEKRILSLTVKKVYRLKVNFSINGTDLVEAFDQKMFRQKNQDNSWTIFFDGTKCLDAERWEVFAETILLSCEMDMDKESIIRDLLQYPSDDLYRRMLRLGVAPETIDDLKHKKTNDPEAGEKKTSPFPRESDKIHENGGNSVALPEHQENEKHPSPSHGDSGNSTAALSKNLLDGRDRTSKRPHPKEGKEAQHSLFIKIKEWCKKKGLPEPSEEQDREDITIPLDPPIIIEVKRIKGKTVYWSQKQIEKAFSYKSRGYPQNYVMALVDSNGEKDEYYWVINPLAKFQALSTRKIQWRWKPQIGGRNYHLESWEKPELPPTKKSDRYSVKIPLEITWIKQLPQGIRNGLVPIISNHH